MTLPIQPSKTHAEPLVGIELIFHVGLRHTTVTVNELLYPGGRRMLRERRYIRLEVRRSELVDHTLERVEQLTSALMQKFMDDEAPDVPGDPLYPPEP